LIVTDTAKLTSLKSVFGNVFLLDADGKNCAFKCPNPICGSHAKNKLKFIVKLENSACHCWVCGLKGKDAVGIAKKINPQAAIHLAAVYDKQHKSVLFDSNNDLISTQFSLPDDFQLIANLIEKKSRLYPDTLHIIDYLQSRKITIDDMWRYKIGVSGKTEYRRHALFPSFNKLGECNFCLARSIDSKQKQKYKNHGEKTHQIIYDEIHVNFSEPLHIFEGVFDLIRSGLNGTALLGSNLSKSSLLFKAIIENKPITTICFDGDVKEKALKAANLLHHYGVDVMIAEFPFDSDPGSLDRETVIDIIRKSKTYTPNTSLLYKINKIKSGTNL
jgi:DNA primase